MKSSFHLKVLCVTLSCYVLPISVFAVSDTLFIIKDTTLEDSHYVFWETNKNSKFYKYVADFKINGFEKDTYKRSLHQLRSNKTVFRKFNLNGLPKEWIILQVYQGKICLYSPNDYYSHFKIKFTDSTMIFWSGEGPEAMQISQLQQLNSNQYEFTIKDRITKVEVNLIDKDKGIAIFTFHQTIVNKGHKETSIWHYLMIDKSKMRKVPFIVNYSLNSKKYELDFDEVDFLKTAKEKRVSILKDHSSNEKKEAMYATSIFGKLQKTNSSLPYSDLSACLIQQNSIVQQTGINASGDFQFTNIDEGVYSISISSYKIKDVKSPSFTLKLGDTIKIDMVYELPCPFTFSSKLTPSCFINHRKNIIPIVYGYVTSELYEKSKKGLLHIGGDMLTGCDPKYYCTIDKIAF